MSPAAREPWPAFERLGEAEVRERLTKGRFASATAKRARAWLDHQESIKSDADRATELSSKAEASVLAREANELVREANSIARDASASARKAADEAERANHHAKRANTIAIIAVVIAMVSMVTSVIVAAS